MKPIIVWVKPLPYEVNIDETKDIIEALISEPIDPRAPHFGTYDEAKARIELKIKLPQAVNKGNRRIAKLKSNTPLILTKSKGEDIDEVEDEDESKEEEEPLKKKGKVIITKPPKPYTIVFTRRTRNKVGEESSSVIFKKPPPTFENRLKALREGSSMANFRALKYETRTKVE